MARFEVLDHSLSLISALRPIVVTLARHDRGLADQVRRAASSVPLNVAEGARRQGRDRQQCYRIAAGSAAEVRAALGVARGWGYFDTDASKEIDTLLDRILAMLWRLTH